MTDEEIETRTVKWFAAIYCIGPKKKQETVFYQKHIDAWTAHDKARFLDVIQTKSGSEVRKES